MLDKTEEHNIILYNSSFKNILPREFSFNADNNRIKDFLSELTVRPIVSDVTINNDNALDTIPFFRFVKSFSNSLIHQGFLELSNDLLIELKIAKGIYEDAEIFILTFIDCTLAKKMEKLKWKSKQKTLTMSMISHELRTPVNSILGSLENIKNQVSPEVKVYLELAKNSCHMLSYQINDLTDYGKITNAKLILDKSKANLDELINECLSIVIWQAKDKKLKLKYIKTATSPEIIWTNPRRIKQVLLNLLSNAIKFTEIGRAHV